MGTPRLPCTLRFVEAASRPGGSATASPSPAAGGSAASAHGCSAAAAVVTPRAQPQHRVSRRAPRTAALARILRRVSSARLVLLLGLAVGGVESCRRKRRLGSLVLRSAVLVRGLRRGRSSARSAPATLVRRWVGLGCWEHADLENTVGVVKVEAPVAHERAFIHWREARSPSRHNRRLFQNRVFNYQRYTRHS